MELSSYKRPQLSISLLFQEKSGEREKKLLKNASLLVCETPFLHCLTVEWMCVCRGSGVNVIADVLYSVNMYIRFLCKTL